MTLTKMKSLKFLLILLALGVCLPASILAASKKAIDSSISLVDGIAVAPNGDVYIAQREHHIITRVDANGMIHKVVGSGIAGYSGDGGPALKAKLRTPAGLLFDKKGNLYIADRENHRIRKVDTQGNITTVAGNGTAGFSGDGGPATEASLNLPSGMTFDSKGNFYISDRSNDRVRVVDTNGIIKTFAGTGKDGYNGDNRPALDTNLDKPFGLAVDSKDNLYIADRGNNRVRKIDSKGIATTFAGDGGFYFIGDNGPAYKASVAGPTDVAVDSEDNVYIADRNNNRIRIVDKLGLIRTMAGTGQQDYNGDSETARETNLNKPFAIAVDKDDNLLVVDRSHYRVRKFGPRGGKVTTIAGNGVKMFGGDGGPATGARLFFPHGIVVDSKDNVLIADKGNFRIRMVTPDGIISTFAGNGVRGNIGDGGPAIDASMFPTVMSINHEDEIYFLSPSGYLSLIRKIDKNGNIDLILSTGDQKYQKAVMNSKHIGLAAKDNRSVVTQFNDVIPDNKGNLYTSDRINNQIRMYTKNGKFPLVGGTGDANRSGDGGPAVDAGFYDPRCLTLDKEGNLYVCDGGNSIIRKIDTKGIVTTIAGTGDFEDYGDGGPATKAGIRSIDDILFSPSGELHFVETGSHIIRKITKDGTIETVAGRSGIQGYFGDNGPARRAMLKQPACIAFDSKGNLYITDMGNNRVRKVDTNGIITTLAGNGIFGWGNEGENVEIYFAAFP